MESTKKPTAELIALVEQMQDCVYLSWHDFYNKYPSSKGMQRSLIKDSCIRSLKRNNLKDRLAELQELNESLKLANSDAARRVRQLEAALETITSMHDGNPSPIANPEPLDYARSVMRDMRLVAKQALQPKGDE